MSITSKSSKIASTLADILRTRLDLIGIEFEEEVVRLSTYFIYTFFALFCSCVAIALFLFFIILFFWDTHRDAVLLTLIGLFSALSVLIMAYLKVQIAKKPPLFGHSMSELKKDMALLTPDPIDQDQRHSADNQYKQE